MGWKSTIDLTREEAIQIVNEDFDGENLNDEELAALVEAVKGGEDHGYNYRIVDKIGD